MHHITQASEHRIRLTVNKLDYFQVSHSVNLIFCRGVSYQQLPRMKAPRKKEEYYCPQRLMFVSLVSQI